MDWRGLKVERLVPFRDPITVPLRSRIHRIVPLFLVLALLVLVLPPSTVHAAGIAYDSTHSNNSGLTSAGSQTDTVTVTAGEMLVVTSGRLDPNTSGSATISDGQLNTFTQQVNILTVTGIGAGGEWLQIWTTTIATSGSDLITITYSNGQNRQTAIIADLFTGVGSISNAQGVLVQNTYLNGVGEFQNNTITLTGVKPSAWVYESDAMQNGLQIDPKALGTGQTFAQKVNNLGATGAQAASDYASTTTATQSMTVFMGNNNGDDYAQAVIELDPATPTITAVSPAAGVGGVAVTITGTNLNGATKITFCGDSQPIFTVVSSTSITTFAPTRTPQEGGELCDIVVTTASGTTAVVTADQFFYQSSTSANGVSPQPPLNYALVVAIVATIVIIGVAVAVGLKRS